MTNLSEIKITQRDGQVLKLLVQGCSNKEIAQQLNIPADSETALAHVVPAGDGRKRVKLATTPRLASGAEGIPGGHPRRLRSLHAAHGAKSQEAR
jgi:FixJ family two-component response regulator